VKRGETLGGIAKKYGTSTAALMRLNGLKKPLILAGQSLVVKGSARKASTKKPAAKASPAKKQATKKKAS